MKRPSDIVYVSSAVYQKTDFRRRPVFDFENLPKLVDYSFHEDSEDECDSKNQNPNPVAELAIRMDSLVADKLRAMSTDLTQETFACRNLRERASLKLKVEEVEEKIRNERLMTQVNDLLVSSRRICDSERPMKKRKLDWTSILDKLVSRKCRLFGGKKKGSRSSSKNISCKECSLDVVRNEQLHLIY